MRIEEWDSGASVETLVSWAGTAPVRTSLVEGTFVREKGALAARSAWTLTRSAQQREKGGPATTRSLQLPCQRVLASLIVLAHRLHIRRIKILRVHAANPLSTPVKILDAPYSGQGWGP